MSKENEGKSKSAPAKKQMEKRADQLAEREGKSKSE